MKTASYSPSQRANKPLWLSAVLWMLGYLRLEKNEKTEQEHEKWRKTKEWAGTFDQVWAQTQEAWLTMTWHPPHQNLRALPWRSWASRVLAAGWEMKSHHQEKRQLLAAKGAWICTPSALDSERNWPAGFDQMRYEFLLMVQCFYIEYLETSKNHGASKMEDNFPL